ncbi:hypothetical protein EDD86DRAFT_220049 [Gorgonomyces haynaldii]|nr:hypothetical protein EDD86DRAFT_220049 [Gorgonomyces haynaldii]
MLVVGLVEEIQEISDKLKLCKINVGQETVDIVTNAPNIKQGFKTVVALVGTELEINGETVVVEKRKVGGKESNGMVCDSKMCGWSSGGVGLAVNLPNAEIGSVCPPEKPYEKQESTVELRDFKQEKLLKKQLAKEKREQKKLQKNA